MTKKYTAFGLQVKIALLTSEMSMTKLADRCGVSLTYLSDILRGARSGEKAKTVEQKIKKVLAIKEVT